VLVVIFGPGGVGKSTLARRLVGADDRLSLSRSWTTRPRRPGESEDAYVFVSRTAFRAAEAEGAFLETNEFVGNGHLYGTPWPEEARADGEAQDVVLEIDVNGARQVRGRRPDAVLVLVVPPSRDELERRLRGRGDDEDHVARRLALADTEVREGRGITDHTVVNDELSRAVTEVAGILDGYRLT
jgi:guanylate kinase